jgi:hypothetical protein
MAKERISVGVRAEGNAGYKVTVKLPGAAPLTCASFENTNEGRREANMFKRGLIMGLRLGANALEGILPEDNN